MSGAADNHEHSHLDRFGHRYHHRHDVDHPHGHQIVRSAVDRRQLFQIGGVSLVTALLAACGESSPATTPASSSATAPATVPVTTAGGGTVTVPVSATDGALAGFDAFASTVNVARSGSMWVVESTGMPTHSMMTGIVSWQQQVPLPQDYTGSNAFQFPTDPVLATTPISAKTALFNGTIAVAVDGVPIFNALNNRGDDAYLVGELDDWGGHAGRADDYHYHAAPLYLQELVGAGAPIAYALDGFAIYGDTEPDGSATGELDELNGHLGADGTYHYHGTRTYPYINGGMRGEVEVVDDHIVPQPVTRPLRPAGEPLRGATITAFDSGADGTYELTYTLADQVYLVGYQVGSDTVQLTYTSPDGTVRTESFTNGNP